MADLELDAFISYRRSDGAKTARWLRRAIERFKPPRKLRDAYGRRLKAYLDTAYERGASDFYAVNIRPALMASRHLIVIGTPDAVKRPKGEDWIQREVTDFASRGPDASVFVVRAKGQLTDPLPADIAARFPNVEIVDLRDVGAFWFLNPLRAARIGDEKLKIVATLLGAPIADIPLFRQEEERRQQTLLGAFTGAAAAIAVLVSGLSIYALDNQRRAQRTLDDALFSVGHVIDATANAESEGEAATNSRRFVLNQACSLMGKLNAQAGAHANVGATVHCLIERAVGYEEFKENSEAEQTLKQAVALAETDYRTAPAQASAISLIAARQGVAEFYKRTGDVQASVALQAVAAEADKMTAVYESTAIAETGAVAHADLADSSAARGDAKAAILELKAAAQGALRAAAMQEDEETQARNLAWAGDLNLRAARLAMDGDDAAEANASATASVQAFAHIAAPMAAAIGSQINAAVAQATAYLVRRELKASDAEPMRLAARATLAQIDRATLSGNDQAQYDQVLAAISGAP